MSGRLGRAATALRAQASGIAQPQDEHEAVRNGGYRSGVAGGGTAVDCLL